MSENLASPSKMDYEALKGAFAQIDENSDGEISKEELEKVLNLHGFYPSSNELEIIVDGVDTNKNGTIDINEFTDMMTKKMDMKEYFEDQDIEKAFQIFDQNGDGIITAEEIKQTMSLLGENVSEAEVSDMLKEADLDGNGLIDFREFSNQMKEIFSKTNIQ